MAPAYFGLASSSPRNPRPRSAHAAVEVHAVNANGRIIFDSQVDVFRDAESKVARLAEILLAEFVFFDLEAAFEDFFGLGSSDGDVHSDLFVATDAKGPDGVAGFACRKWSVEPATIISHASSEGERGRNTHCRQGFVQTTVPTPLQHG